MSEKLLRPAGESLRRELEKLDDQLNESLLQIILAPAMAAAMLLMAKPFDGLSRPFFLGLVILTGGIWFVFQTRKTIRLIQRRRDYRLGFAGERAVAEELNHLMLEGCRIFHDVPMEPYGNIDHVVIAPTGVYAVETKARRKRKAPPGKREFEIVFDGKTLQFPGSTESHSLHQARQQADRLRIFLSKAVGESVKVGAILTFPGWYVTTRAPGETKVLNPKNIKSAVLNRKLPPLDPQLLQRISHQLDQKCRDVEF